MQEHYTGGIGIEKIIVAFGTVITFLLTVITVMLKYIFQKFTTEHDRLKEDVQQHETRITVLEKQ